ncbi:MAG: LD-carboxypeptidase [Candidatus Neomarinimicrobiota bacterium]
MLKPQKLLPDSTIGIVSPSYWWDEILLKKTALLLSDQGFKLEFGNSIFLKNNAFAGQADERADDLQSMFSNNDIQAIFCVRGGYGANRVLPLLDFDLIRNNPKIFMGYSDITALLTSITQETRLVTFHGPMLIGFKDGLLNYNYSLMNKVLGGGQDIVINPPENFPCRVLKQGKAEGPLWGGNITLLMNRLGTSTALNTAGSILFLEDVNEYYYNFDRILFQFRQAGFFDSIKGLIFGELKNMKDEQVPFGKSTDEIILDICGDLDIPIISNFPCGHGKYQATLPLSVKACLDATGLHPVLTLLESPVE